MDAQKQKVVLIKLINKLKQLVYDSMDHLEVDSHDADDFVTKAGLQIEYVDIILSLIE